MGDDAVMPAKPFSVIIPAYNEEAVIERTLRTLSAGAPAGAMEVIVVCNGCRDRTAEVARRALLSAKVIELEQGSKPLALNTGNAAASHTPRLFVDADVTVSFATLASTARALEQEGCMVAVPALVMDTSQSSLLVRSFYEVWQRQPYASNAMGGSGVYGLSAAGLETIGSFPTIIADDEFIRTRFPAEQRRGVTRTTDGGPAASVVMAPRDLVSLIKIESRQRAGLSALRKSHPTGQTEESLTTSSSLLSSIKGPTDALKVAAYVAIKVAGRLHARAAQWRGQDKQWLRDDSSRS